MKSVVSFTYFNTLTISVATPQHASYFIEFSQRSCLGEVVISCFCFHYHSTDLSSIRIQITHSNAASCPTHFNRFSICRTRGKARETKENESSSLQHLNSRDTRLSLPISCLHIARRCSVKFS